MSSQDSSGDGPSVVVAVHSIWTWKSFAGEHKSPRMYEYRCRLEATVELSTVGLRASDAVRKLTPSLSPFRVCGRRRASSHPHLDAASDGRYVTRPVAQPKAINAGSAIMAGRVRDPVARSTPQSRQWSDQASVRRAKQQGTHDYRTRCISVAACRPPLCTHPFPPAAGSRTTASSSCLKETRCPPHSGTPA